MLESTKSPPLRRRLDVRLRLHTPLIADGGGRVVHPCPTTHSEVRCRMQRVHEGGVSAANARNCEGVVCANNVVRALLPVGGQAAIGQVVAGQTLVPYDVDAVFRPHLHGLGAPSPAPGTPLAQRPSPARRPHHGNVGVPHAGVQ